MPTIQERLQEVYRRLGNTPRATSAQEALDELARILEEVENDMSGIPKKSPPPPNMPDGRMYPPLADHTTYNSAGGIEARTRGHVIDIAADGSTTIRNKRTGAVEFSK